MRLCRHHYQGRQTMALVAAASRLDYPKSEGRP
jgi:hypothetical protein